MIVEELRKSILNYAIKGLLSQQNEGEENNLNDVLPLKMDGLYNIPSNWKWVRVKDICDLIRGSGIKRTETVSEGVQCIRYGEIYTDYSYSFDKSISFVSEELANCCKNVNTGDVLLTLTGENEYDIAKATAYLGNERLVAGGDLAILTNHKQNPLYLSYFFASPFAIKQKSKSAKGNIIVHTSTDKIGDYIIPIPPLEEQNRIVNKIEELFKKLEEARPIEKELNEIKSIFAEKMKNSILLDAYLGNLSLEDSNNWKEYNIKDIADIYTGNSIPELVKKSKYTNLSDGYNYIGTKDLKLDHSFEYENGIKIPYNEEGFKYALPNDILMCIEGGSAGKKIGILNEKVCFGNKLCKFSANKKIITDKYLYYYLQSPVFLKNFNENLSGIIGGVSINKIKELSIKIPSLEEQNRLVTKIENILPICNEIEAITQK